MKYTIKLNFGNEQEILSASYDELQAQSTISYLLKDKVWWKQESKNWDFEAISSENILPNFIINFKRIDDESN